MPKSMALFFKIPMKRYDHSVFFYRQLEIPFQLRYGDA